MENEDLIIEGINIKKIITENKPLTEKENYKLIKLYKEGGEKDKGLYNRLILGNLGLIYTIAARYYQIIKEKYSIDDLVHEGIKGLIGAIKNYSFKKNKKAWQAYKSKCIEGAILTCIPPLYNQLKMPNQVRTDYYHYCAIKNELKQKLNRVPEIDEIVDYFNNVVVKENRKGYKSGIKKYTKDVCFAFENIMNSDNNRSLYEELPNVDGVECVPLYQIIEEKTIYESETAEDVEYAKNLIWQIKKVICKKSYSKNSDKKLDCILRYIGLPPYDEPQTYEKIASVYNVSHQAIRQLIDRALVRLSKSSFFKELYEQHNNKKKEG